MKQILGKSAGYMRMPTNDCLVAPRPETIAVAWLDFNANKRLNNDISIR